MPEPDILPPVADPTPPRLALPPGSCDAHCHVFGPHAVFPYASERTFTPADAPKERLFALHRLLGIERTVIVQSACHGTDHAALLDALAAAKGRARGIALITPHTAAEEIARLAAAGVRGFRVNFMPHLGEPPSREAVEAMLALGEPHGWHVQVHVAGRGILDYAELIAALPGTVVIDHMARVDLGDEEAIRALLELLDSGRVWVKLSGADRIAREPDLSDAAALARRLLEHAPERALWGTDFPHPNHRGPVPDDGALVDLLEQIAPGEAALRRLLVDNPAELFFTG
jgi:2-pyrone-4,6-dicarboxylate lactonase